MDKEYLQICQSTERQQQLKAMKEASLDELKNLIGDDATAMLVFESLRDAKEGYIRIVRQFPYQDAPIEGWTYVFTERLPLHLDNPHDWYSTSNIEHIDWDGGTFTTRNSVYTFEFLDKESTPKLSLRTPYELFGVEVEKGWVPLVKPIIERIQTLNAQGAGIEITQIKEKWGELCVYLNRYPEGLDRMIQDAAEKSKRVCEHCGKPARRIFSTTGWVHTLCPDCLRERGIQVDRMEEEEDDA